MTFPLRLVEAVHLIACGLAFGGYVFAVLVLPRFFAREALAVAMLQGRASVALARWSAWIALMSAVLWLLCQAVSTSGISTGFGHLWIARLGIAALLCLLAVRREWGGGRSGAPLGLVLSGALLASLAGVGHAAAVPLERAVQMTIYGVHLLAAGAWIGALPPLALLARRAARGKPEWRDLALATTERFSMIGLTAVIALFVTGMVNAGRWLGPVTRIADTEYGRLLIAKLVLFAVMLMLATYNGFWLTARLERAEAGAARKLNRSVWVEFAVGAVILVLAASLATTLPGAAIAPPPAQARAAALSGVTVCSTPKPSNSGWPSVSGLLVPASRCAMRKASERVHASNAASDAQIVCEA
jgi:putative copper resistance protein D